MRCRREGEERLGGGALALLLGALVGASLDGPGRRCSGETFLVRPFDRGARLSVGDDLAGPLSGDPTRRLPLRDEAGKGGGGAFGASLSGPVLNEPFRLNEVCPFAFTPSRFPSLFGKLAPKTAGSATGRGGTSGSSIFSAVPKGSTVDSGRSIYIWKISVTPVRGGFE